MRNRYTVREPLAAHFVTSTTVAWLPVFTTAARCDILIESLKYCQANKELKVYGFVILDTHFHAILRAPDLTRVMADFKRHTARQMLNQLESEQCHWLLHELRHFRGGYKKSEYQLWQEGFCPEAITSDEMMLQKLDYLHNNPVKRGLVAAPEHWRYSSAHAWCGGVEPVMQCDDWRG